MPSLKFNVIVDNKGGKVAMQQFARETDAAFKRSAASVRRVSLAALPEHERSVVKVKRKYQSLNTQIDKLAKSGRISNQMATEFHNNVGIRMQNDLKALEKKGNKTFKALGTAAKAASVVMLLAIGGAAAKISADGLKAVEDHKLSVASLSAFISTFSQKSAQGDIAGGFKEANEYAGLLVVTLEKIDSKTIATGKDLGVMAETMAQNGALLDINNQKQVQGFTNIANALKLVTAGQNADIQMRQEINALLQGQIRATDRLPKLLKAIDPQLQEHLKIWKEQGTTVERVGELLAGFGESATLIEKTWAAVGTSLITIKDRVLRDGFKPIYEDLLKLADQTRAKLVDASGELTPLAINIQNTIGGAYRSLKLGAMGVKAEMLRIGMLIDKVGGTMTFLASLPSAIPAAMGIDSSEARMQKFVEYNAKYESRYKQKEAELQRLAKAHIELLATPFKVEQQKQVTAPELAPQVNQEAVKKADAADKKRLAKELKDSLKEQADIRAILNRQLEYEEKIVGQIIAGEETLAQAVMTESQRSIYAIEQQYAAYGDLIQQQVEAGNQTEEWGAKTHEVLGVRMQEDLDALKDKNVEVTTKMKEEFAGWADGMSSKFTDMVFGAELSFGSILESFGKMLTQMVIKYQIIQPLVQGLFGAMGGSIGGSAGTSLSVPSAAGGYDVPSGANPMVQIHEEEMVLPKEYANIIRNGSLGGGSVTNVIVNNTSKAQASTTEMKNASGGKNIVIMIEEIVGKSISSGRGSIAKAMNSTYGARPQLAGR